MYNENHKQGSTLAWLALLVGSLALILSILAYNRSGRDLNDLVKETTNKTLDEVKEVSSTVAVAAPTVIANAAESAEQARARMDLEAKLVALKTRVAINRVDNNAANEVAKMRADYDSAFVNADSNAKARAALVDTKLGQLESDLRAGTANVLLSLESALENLRQNVTN